MTLALDRPLRAGHTDSLGELRIRPVPLSEPVTDDERRTGDRTMPAVASVRAPDLATGVRVRRSLRPRGADPGRAGTPDAPRHHLPVPPPARPPHEVAPAPTAQESPTAAAPTDSPQARELRLAARRLLAACVEVLGGFRPVGQLRPYCAPERFESIVHRLLRPGMGMGRGHAANRSSVVATAPGPGRPSRVPSGERVTVRHVQLCDVLDGVAEIAVVMSRREKVWAMALRMERTRGRWQCSHLEVI